MGVHTAQQAAVDPTRRAVAARLRDEARAVAEVFVEELRAVHPLYAAVEDEQFNAQMVEASLHSVELFSRCLDGGSGLLDERELTYYRSQAVDAASQLVPLEALQEPVRVGGRVLWRWLLEACRGLPGGDRATVDLLDELSRFKDALERALTDAYIDTRFQPAGPELQLRRDLVDALLDGRPLGSQVRTRLAASFGLDDGGGCIVLVTASRSGGPPPDPQRLIGTALERGGAYRLLVADRQDELVGVVPLRAGIERIVEGVADWLRQLRRVHGLGLLVGMSTPGVLADVPDRYAEARTAMHHGIPNDEGLVALPLIRPFDHLLSRIDGTTHRLVPPGVQALVYEDQRRNGSLSETLSALADADLNVARAAEQLFLHPNTVHYRLRVIAELSGRNPRSFRDLVDMLIALRALER